MPIQDVEFDPAKARSNRRKHGVGLEEAATALDDPRAITIDDPDSEGERRLLTLGMDGLGRVLVVCHTPKGQLTRLVSARKASPGEARCYLEN